MQLYCENLIQYQRLNTKEVSVGGLLLGNYHPIRVQTMTTTDTMDTISTVEQSVRCIEAGAELIRITAPSIKEAENLLHIKKELHRRGYKTPLVADIHFTPNAAEAAARIVEKVRINPGNYVDKKKFESIEYTDIEYIEEIERIRDRFIPLINICKEYGTAMRIGTNHGSLSDRIMSRYGDTPMGMVESAMEFLRIARAENYHNIVLSMKASNPMVMVQAYRMLVTSMYDEFRECYPLHLGVTEAGDGEDGRIKSAIGIGTLLEDGLGDTIRVSLTEDPELEIPVCRDIIKRYSLPTTPSQGGGLADTQTRLMEDAADNGVVSISAPLSTGEAPSFKDGWWVVISVPYVIADLSKLDSLTPKDLESIGYTFDETTDKWNISDMAADYIFTGHHVINFVLPDALKVISHPSVWAEATDKTKHFPIYTVQEFAGAEVVSKEINFVMIDCFNIEDGSNGIADLEHFMTAHAERRNKAVLCLSSTNKNAMQSVRLMFKEMKKRHIENPTILVVDSNWNTADEHLIHFATEAGALLLDGYGDGICLGMSAHAYAQFQEDKTGLSGRRYTGTGSETAEQFMNNTAFSILQATRKRISKTDYISCPSCGRTLFDLQETTARIRSITNHLKGVKIAIMGCIVNGPGEMADADFGYVGSGPGKITLYKGKEIVKRNVASEVAVEELVTLLKENNAWVEPAVK